MRFSTIVAASALALGVSAGRHHNGTIVTEVVTEYTTYCPEPTTLTHGGKTYTVTEATTITLPCPTGCHVTKTLTSSPAPTPEVPAGNSSAPVPPTKAPTAAPPAPTGTTPAPPAFTGAASQLVVSGGAMAAVFGIAAYLL